MPVVFSGYQHTLYLITCFSFNRIPYNTGFAALHFHNSSYSQLFIFAAFHFRSSSGETGEREKKKKDYSLCTSQVIQQIYPTLLWQFDSI